MVFVSHIKPQHLMALTFISVHKDEDHPERCSSPMASFPSFRALCHLKRWTDNKAASSYSFFSISSLLRSCYSKFHTKFDCVTLLEAPLQEVASLFFYGPISSWWVIWLVSCQTPLHPRIFPGTNFRLQQPEIYKKSCLDDTLPLGQHASVPAFWSVSDPLRLIIIMRNVHKIIFCRTLYICFFHCLFVLMFKVF